MSMWWGVLAIGICVILLLSPARVSATLHESMDLHLPTKESCVFLSHPDPQAMIKQNQANIQYNVGVVAGQKAASGIK